MNLCSSSSTVCYNKSVSAQGLTGICYYFLRTNPEKAVTQSSIAQEVLFGSLDCSGGKLLDVMERMFSQVMMPVLKAQEVRGDRGIEGGLVLGLFEGLV